MLWDKKDNLYAEGSTVRNDKPYFYYYYENYSQFFISKDWVGYTPGSGFTEGYVNNTFESGPDYSYDKAYMETIKHTLKNGTSYNLYTVFMASNGFGREGAVLFRVWSTDDSTRSPAFGVISTTGYGAVTISGTSGIKDAWVLLNLTYNQSSNSYIFSMNMYDCASKKWWSNRLSTENNNINFSESGLNALKMPDGYNPQNFSEYFPKFIINMSEPGEYTFSNFLGYSINITEAEAEEIINGKFFYSKTNNSMYALFYNEYTQKEAYPNTTFYHDGTIIPRGQLVEGAINQVCKNGDIKSQEFIEY